MGTSQVECFDRELASIAQHGLSENHESIAVVVVAVVVIQS